MTRTILVLTLLLFCGLASAQPAVPYTNQWLVPLYLAHHPGSTDHFYTTSLADYNYARSLGFDGYGVVAYLESTKGPNTEAFRRFYSPSYTDHFYTWGHLVGASPDSPSEIAHVLSNGWNDEGYEGYIYTIQVPGSVPFYRLSTADPITFDHDHYYTTSASERNNMISSGWNYDGVAGFVYTSPNPSAGGGGLVMGYRSDLEPNHTFCNAYWNIEGNPEAKQSCLRRSVSFGEYGLAQTGKQWWTSVQRVSFDFISYGLNASGDHFGVMLRSEWDWSSRSKDGYYYWGSGPAIGRLDFFCGSGNAVLETFWNGSGASIYSPQTCGPSLQDGVTYTVHATLSDSGIATYQIWQGSVLLGSASQNVSNVGSWHPESQGLLIVPASIASSSYTIYFSNISAYWTN